ncbi:hypothetical protein DVR12_09585 [Chitinophaga silvatica]|uniref:Uncharacterized protein n=1 Tax=Chitinophaga silvatica TaxID=2282649 RepID=A0A3E1YB22_9BACT|nr:hypothetical protein [Chitinophaga silvatica]RFS23262.1 hypothetical protein DVR12_09585 [Chitinophaga silvatica]
MFYTRIFVLLATVFLIASCGGNHKTSQTDTSLGVSAAVNSQLDVNPLSGYFLKNTIQVNDSLTFWIIDNQQTFDSLFGVAKTMTNKITQPDFGTQIVVAATMPPTYYNTQIELADATLDDDTNDATMRFTAIGNANKSSSSIIPLWLGTVPKMGKSTFSFYNGDKLVTTITTEQ